MSTILDQIVSSKRREVEQARAQIPLEELERRLRDARPVRDFWAALAKPAGIQVIAEVKKASPSAGLLCAQADVVSIARSYQEHGAACVSVLTDTPFFQGNLGDLARIREQIDIPVLRKDFILEPYQVIEARAAGADAVLLIAEILDDQQLVGLLGQIHALGMEALVELYEPANVMRVLASGASLVGINNRNLHTFETRLEHTLTLAHRISRDRCLVSESGIRTRADVERLEAAGIKAILVGETLMRAPDVGVALAELRGTRQTR